MTFTTYDTPANIVVESPDTLRAAALAVSRSLPASGGVTVEAPHVLAEAPPLHDAPGAQAVTVAVTGTAEGNVTLVVADDVAAALRAGPLGADGRPAKPDLVRLGPVADERELCHVPAGTA